MDKVLKTTRISSELAGISFSKVAGAIEDYAFQLTSVQFLQQKGEREAARKLQEKIIWDLGEHVSRIVGEGLAKKKHKKKASQKDDPAQGIPGE